MVQDQRAAETDIGEPIHTEAVCPYDNGGHFVVGVTSFARKFHSVTAGDELTVEVYHNGIFIDTSGGDE